MATTQVQGVRCAALSCAVPETIEGLETDRALYGDEAAIKMSAATGVVRRRVVTPDLCTSDLCYAAARRAIEQAGWDTASIDGLIFVSQTPDYLLPATSCTLQARLGLGSHCAAFDVNLGCSGYTYGLWLASTLIHGGLNRVALLVGDTVSRIAAKEDRSTRPLFGDAGTATLLERDPTSTGPWTFITGTDGTGRDHLIVKSGLFRDSPLNGQPETQADGRLHMNGAEIFTFTLREVPPLVTQSLAAAGWSQDNVDAVVMHQANEFMLKHLGKRMKLPAAKQPYSLQEFGNTSSASIPLTIAASLAERCATETLNLLLVGFGVGYSWATAALTLGPFPQPEILTVSATDFAEERERRAC